jgi:hypothetical protein
MSKIGNICAMEALIRKVRDIEESERHMLEHVLGRPLHENQQISVQVVTLGDTPAQTSVADDTGDADALPDWCNVYEGLTAEQIADMESVVLDRANLKGAVS